MCWAWNVPRSSTLSFLSFANADVNGHIWPEVNRMFILLAYVFHLYLQGLVWNGENGDRFRLTRALVSAQ